MATARFNERRMETLHRKRPLEEPLEEVKKLGDPSTMGHFKSENAKAAAGSSDMLE